MQIFIEKDNQTKTIKFDGTALQLIKKLNLNPEAVLVVKNNTLITEEDKVNDNDEIKILSVISGG